MSELKQKILEGIDLNGLQRYARREVQPYYDNWEEYGELTDEDIDELATDILNEINKQPALNDNQQKELKKMKNSYEWFGKSLENGLFDYMTEEDKTELSNDEFAQILRVFIDWVNEREED